MSTCSLTKRYTFCGSRRVTPGIRPIDAMTDDQSRITTPQMAIQNGADYLVIGRPISRAEDPLLMLQHLNKEIEEQLAAN